MSLTLRNLRTSALWALTASTIVVGCGSEVVVFQGTGGSDDPSTSSVSVGGTGGTGGIGGTGGAPTTGGTGPGPGPGPSVGGSGGCMDEILPTEPVYDPLDVVLVVDNGFNMDSANAALEGAIYASFFAPLENAGVDQRLVAVTDHGFGSQQLCVPPPISGTNNCNGPPVEVNDQFYHYDVDINFGSALCMILDTAWGGQPDQNSYHPGGWVPLLRPQAHHALVVYTFSGIGCVLDGKQYFDQNSSAQGQTVALDWDKALLSLAPGTFGSQADRRYVFHSFIGMPPKSPDPLAPYNPFEPVETNQCNGTFAPGTGYQWLSKGTEGLRFPSCQFSGVSTMLGNLASELLATTLDLCSLQLTEEPVNEEAISTVFTPDQGAPEKWDQVQSEAACGATDDTFYLDEESPPTIRLCPQTCQKRQTTPGNVQALNECTTVP